MTALPRRRTRPKMGLREETRVRCPGHLQFVRSRECCVATVPCDPRCEGKMHAHHVRKGAGAGMGEKPGDDRTVPLCAKHHKLIHDIGQDTFDARFGLDLEMIAEALWQQDRERRIKHERAKET